jgi:hypothetical protein
MPTVILRILPLLASLITLWLLGLPWIADSLLALGLIGLLSCYPIPLKRQALLLASIWFGLLLGEAFFRLEARIIPQPQAYYRPEERFARNGSFIPNIDIEMSVPHGDLIPVEPALGPALSVARRTHFKTDHRGLRNSGSLEQADVLLIGDSFILGTSNTQSNLLATVLDREYATPSYSLGLPLAPDWLLKMVPGLLAEAPQTNQLKTLLFIFEGNDFIGPTQDTHATPLLIQPSPYDQFKLRCIQQLGFHTGHRIFNLTRRLLQQQQSEGEPIVSLQTIAGKPIGFLNAYRHASLWEQPRLSLPQEVAPIAARLDGVFFIPTKYRVYQPWLTHDLPSPPLPTPPPALLELQRIFSPLQVPVIDLTPTLQTEATNALTQGELVFWPDDTHWNSRGISAAAQAVHRFLQHPPEATVP